MGICKWDAGEFREERGKLKRLNGVTVGRSKVDFMSLSGCAWVERISLHCLPHRNIYSSPQKTQARCFGAF